MSYRDKWMNSGFSGLHSNSRFPPPPTKAVQNQEAQVVELQGVRPFGDDGSARGIIITRPVTIEGNQVSCKAVDLDELRMNVLFWDRIEIPQNSVLGGGEDAADIEFLVSEGLINKPHAVIGSFSGNPAWGIVAAQRGLFEELERVNPGQWAIGAGENAPVFESSKLVEGRGLLFRLANGLPIPTRDVPLADVLEFKVRRRSELIALRHHLSDVYQAIRSAPDRPLAEVTELDRLDRAAANYVKVQLETRRSLKLSDLGAKLDIGAGIAAFTAGQLAWQAGLPLTQTALAAAGGAALRVVGSIGSTASLKGRESASPYQYLVSIHRDLGSG